MQNVIRNRKLWQAWSKREFTSRVTCIGVSSRFRSEFCGFQELVMKNKECVFRSGEKRAKHFLVFFSISFGRR